MRVRAQVSVSPWEQQLPRGTHKGQKGWLVLSRFGDRSLLRQPSSELGNAEWKDSLWPLKPLPPLLIIFLGYINVLHCKYFSKLCVSPASGRRPFSSIIYLLLQYCSSQAVAPLTKHTRYYSRRSKEAAACAVVIWDSQVVDYLSPEEVALSKGVVHRAYLVLAMAVFWRQTN